ncbi:hypothetical protein [Micromonospora sp. NPDC023888]|uniref:hypothetical protein n=1 Tax=Micromonospora sp. NPDC023888 TaxID=3155607 RepID=UPI0033CCF1A4
MGHDSPRAALIYQHANREADQVIADAIDKAVRAARRKPSRRRTRPGAEDDGTGAEAGQWHSAPFQHDLEPRKPWRDHRS